VQGMYLHTSILLGLLCMMSQTKIDNPGHPT
jgi:hypothetical protein